MLKSEFSLLVIFLGVAFAKSADCNCGQLTYYLPDNDTYVDLKSPGFPNNYPSGCQCHWVFRTVTPQKLNITFSRFNTANASDQVRILDGPNLGDPLIERCSGTSCGLAYSTGTEMSVVFNSRRHYSGRPRFMFRAQIRGADRIFWNNTAEFAANKARTTPATPAGPSPFPEPRPCDCGWRETTLPSNESFIYILSPGWPENYPKGCHCQWTVLTTPGHRLSLDFDQFGFTTLSPDDRLQVYGGAHNKSSLIESCHQFGCPTVTTNGTATFITFDSRHTFVGKPIYNFRGRIRAINARNDSTSSIWDDWQKLLIGAGFLLLVTGFACVVLGLRQCLASDGEQQDGFKYTRFVK